MRRQRHSLTASTPTTLATTLLAELEKGTHQWLSSLPRVAYSAAGCDDATRAALCATAGGGLGDCAFVRSVGQARGRADQRWARSFVVANALRVKSGHLRLAPLFTLLNHGEDGLRPTELEDGALRLEAARDLRPGDDVRINYGHGSHGGARRAPPLRMVPVDGSDRIRRL